jgi:ABC-type antimicrobial peptide transport system permease subunit
MFNADDRPGAPTTIVINEHMARKLFPGEDPIGRHLRFGGATAPWATVVGVIGDVRHSALEDAPAPELYVWYLQNPPVNPFIVIRASADAASLASQVRAQVQATDKEIVAYDVRPMTQVRAESVAQRRFVLLLVAAFGVLALSMAAVGVYGVMALVVSERRSEIGIRLALGATPATVLLGVMREGLLLAGAGVGVGLLVASLLVPLLGTQLFGVRPFDPATMAGVPLLLMIVALLACVVPARRAMATDPVDALRA